MRVMTSSDNDWIDDILKDEPCNGWQIGTIEGLLITSAANYLYQNLNFNELTYEDADKIIKILYENNIPRDPKEQYKIMQKKGVFE